MVYTLGLLMPVSVTTADIQDRTAAYRVLEQLRFVMASVVTVFADGGYAGKLLDYARRKLDSPLTPYETCSTTGPGGGLHLAGGYLQIATENPSNRKVL